MTSKRKKILVSIGVLLSLALVAYLVFKPEDKYLEYTEQ